MGVGDLNEKVGLGNRNQELIIVTHGEEAIIRIRMARISATSVRQMGLLLVQRSSHTVKVMIGRC